MGNLPEGTYYVEVYSAHGDISRNYSLSIVAPAGPDLKVMAAAVSSVWQSADLGTAATWTVTVKNNGWGWQRAAWTVQWYLSSDRVYQATDTLIGSQICNDDLAPGASISKTLNAPVPAAASAGQKFVIARVVNSGPDSSAADDLISSVDADWFAMVVIPTDVYDAAARNDSRATATNLGLIRGLRSILGLTLDRVGGVADVDYYKFSIARTAGPSHRVRLDFDNRQGDLTLSLLDASGAVIGTADTARNCEQISLNRLPAGDYYLLVTGKNGDVSPGYSLGFNTP
jgi:hypothetical protein